MEVFPILKWLHILSSTVLFGTGIGTAFHMWMSNLRGDTGQIALAARNTVQADWLFTMPSGLVQPATGIGLILAAGWDPFASWLVVSYVLYLLAFGCWVPVVVIQIRIARLAEAAVCTGADLPPRYRSMIRIWFWLGWPAFLGLMGVFWLMVSKPVLW